MKIRKRYRFWTGLDSFLALLFAAGIVLMLNYLSFRHYTRKDISFGRLYTLSDKTVSLLDSLSRPVHITVLFEPGHELYDDVNSLIREYQAHSKMLDVQWINPHKDLSQMERLGEKYEISQANVVIFDCAGRSKYVRANEIAAKGNRNNVARIVSFKGEQAFSSAILNVLQETVPVVYFLTGHGERSIADFDHRTGYSGIAQWIENDNVHIRPLLLNHAKRIPAECAALVIAGATKTLARAEIELIHHWLLAGGRLMVLSQAHQTSGLEPLLRAWGVLLRNDMIIDANAGIDGFVPAGEYGAHAITEKLDALAATFLFPRSVEPDYSQFGTNSVDRPQVTALALSSRTSWSETNAQQFPPRFDANSADRHGPVSIAAAVEKGAPAGLLDIQIRPTRIVVFGDTGFVSNSGLTGSNISFFMSALNWLLDREELMAIAPKQVDNTLLQLTYSKLQFLFWAVAGIIPALAAIFGLFIWSRRKK
ncbi:MAG: GldG family protein [Kiritimatiellales bacterium]